jgi:hypothetical protein
MPGRESNNKGTTKHQLGALQLEVTGLEAPETRVSQQTRKGRYRAFKRPPANPDLFPNSKTDCMASNRLIWEGSNILTQGRISLGLIQGKGHFATKALSRRAKGMSPFG